MIKLRNGFEVLRADVQVDPDKVTTSGYVLARAHNEYVTWHVARLETESLYTAYTGHYHGDDFEEAVRDYDRRRGFNREAALPGRGDPISRKTSLTGPLSRGPQTSV